MDPGPASGGALPGQLEEGGKRCASVVSPPEDRAAPRGVYTLAGTRPPCLAGPQSVCELVCVFAPGAAGTHEECGGSAVSGRSSPATPWLESTVWLEQQDLPSLKTLSIHFSSY